MAILPCMICIAFCAKFAAVLFWAISSTPYHMINVNRNCPDAFEMSLICNLILRTAMFEDLNEILVLHLGPFQQNFSKIRDRRAWGIC